MPSFSAPSTRRMLTIAPVPISALPKATSSPPWIFAVRASGSSDITLRAGQQLDAVLLVPGGRVDVGVGALGLAAQVLLGDRRPFVGRLRLAADQQDRALGAAPAQLGGAVGGGHAAADQQEVDLAVSHR